MKIKTYTVNETGLTEIKNFLVVNHLNGEFGDNEIRAWAADADFQLAEGNSATIEIRSANSVSGAAVCYTVSDAGLDCEEVEVGEDD